MKKVHFIGIGGIGVSALAQWYLSEGWEVSGSDAEESATTRDLTRKGISVFIGHRPANVKNADLVICSSAIPENNPERTVALRKKIQQQSYHEALGELTKSHFTVAVSGSHGKSTTTAMLALILIKAGLDPTVIVGTKLPRIGGNFRKGKGKYLLIEADEYRRAFYSYFPRILVLTNIDKEHLDIYRTYAGVLKGFARYLKNLHKEGVIVANYKDEGIQKIVKNVPFKIVWYNKGTVPLRKLRIPGAHNQLNAEAAARAARALGIKKETIEAALSQYKGAWRRLEKIDTRNKAWLKNVHVFSDYAHHPTEIRATLRALRDAYPSRKIIGIFQPHQTDRFTRLFRDFEKSFGDADVLILLPVYNVRGRDVKKGKTSQDLAQKMRTQQVGYAPDFALALRMVRRTLGPREKAVLVFMSAGDLDGRVRTYFGV